MVFLVLEAGYDRARFLPSICFLRRNCNNMPEEHCLHRRHQDHFRSVALMFRVKHCRSCRSNRSACHRACSENGKSIHPGRTKREEVLYLGSLEACSMYSAKYRFPNKRRTYLRHHTSLVLRKSTVRRCSLLTHRWWRSRKLGTIRVHRIQILGRSNHR